MKPSIFHYFPISTTPLYTIAIVMAGRGACAQQMEDPTRIQVVVDISAAVGCCTVSASVC